MLLSNNDPKEWMIDNVVVRLREFLDRLIRAIDLQYLTDPCVRNNNLQNYFQQHYPGKLRQYIKQ